MKYKIGQYFFIKKLWFKNTFSIFNNAICLKIIFLTSKKILKNLFYINPTRLSLKIFTLSIYKKAGYMKDYVDFILNSPTKERLPLNISLYIVTIGMSNASLK